MSFTNALDEDRAGHIELAAAAYEDELRKEATPELGMLMKLVVLYWQQVEHVVD
ncbi:MAG: hypothetical protein RL701_7768 [Pseudomonadota bacterium]|jgi:predicted TPR repeat methyltransferase